ncbi:MAG: single-stranded DNA-binding protein [Nitrososphaerales archaeon]
MRLRSQRSHFVYHEILFNGLNTAKLISPDVMTNDVDIQKMIDTILRQTMNLTKDDLNRMIEEKKERIGAGYLTDQGALFLVAADLGIMLEELPKLEMSLKDVYSGAKQVSVIARVMNVYPVKKYRRKDGSDASLRTMIVYDNDTRLKVKLWDEMAVLPEKLAIKSGDSIKISKAYTRSGMDGKIAINAGAGARIELIEDSLSRIQDIDSLAKDASEVTQLEENIIVTGEVRADPRVSSFTNLRGEASKVMHLQIAGSDGKSFRVVIWNIDEERVPKIININAKIKMIGIRSKKGPSGDMELHGDEGTVIDLVEEPEEIEVMHLRIVSVSRNTGKRQDSFALVIDKAKANRIFTVVTDDAIIEQLKPDIIVECMPSRVYGNTLLLRDDAYVRVIDDDPTFPDATSVEIKIKDVKPSEELYFLEAVTLSAVMVKDIKMRDGSEVKYSEIMLGDDTAEMRLVGWRETASLISHLSIGQRVKAYGVMAYTGRDGNTELRLKPFSSIIKL